MAVNKRGMFFTLMSISLMTIILFIFLYPSKAGLTERMAAIESRVLTMNNFLEDVERDVERALFISSFRALIAMEASIINNGEFLSDVDGSFKEAVLDGTINNVSYKVMDNSRLPDWIGRIQSEAQKFNIILNITVNDITIEHSDAWRVRVTANITIEMNDLSSVANWTRTISAQTTLPIQGLEDPLYIIGTNGRATAVINQSIFAGALIFQQGGSWNVSNLIRHAENSWYAENPDAPSFLMRFENNLSNSSFGIESFVNLQKLQEKGITINSGASVIDHQYWNGVLGSYRINNTPTWVRTDLVHVNWYNLTPVAHVG